MTLSVDNGSIPEEAGVATFTAELSVVTTVAVTVDLGITGSGNGRLNAADASLVAQSAALILVPRIPAIPGGVVITGINVPDLDENVLDPPVVIDPLSLGPGSGDSAASTFNVVENFVSQPSTSLNSIDSLMNDLAAEVDDATTDLLSLWDDLLDELL